MNTERILKKQRSIHMAILIAMAVGTLFVVYMAFVFNISRDIYVMANSVLGIAVLAFELLLIIGISFSDYEDAQITWNFSLMTFFAFLSTFCSLFTYEAYALAEYSELIRVMHLLAYCAGSMHYGFLWSYIRALDDRKAKSKAWDHALWSILILYNLLIIADIFLGLSSKAEAGSVLNWFPSSRQFKK